MTMPLSPQDRTGGYVLVLTEEGYTTADGPMPRPEAIAAFDHFTTGTWPQGGSRLRVMTEVEYLRLRATAPNPAAWADCHLPGTPVDVAADRHQAEGPR